MTLSVHLTEVFFLIMISEESAGRHKVAPADGMEMVSRFIMPRRHASAKTYGYASDDMKLPSISAIRMCVCPGMIGHAFIIIDEASVVVE